MGESKREYIVYKITCILDNKIYIGCHSTLNRNDRYMGSGVEIKEALKKFGRKCFVKEIFFVFDTKEEMLAKEKELVTKEFCMRTDTMNRIEGGGVYVSVGMATVKDQDGNTMKVYCDDPRYLSGELVGHSKGIENIHAKGKVTVKDELGNTFQTSKTDQRYLSGELVSIYKGIQPFDWTGKNHTEESKKRMSDAGKLKLKELNSMYGKIHTDETKQKIKDNLNRIFYVYDLENNLISIEQGIKEYAIKNGFNRSKISAVLNGKKEEYRGFKFSYI